MEAGVELVDDADLRWDLLTELLATSERSLRNTIADAHLAALAISRGATLASFDDDFAAFSEIVLRWEQLAS